MITQPWKNSKGTTREICVGPGGEVPAWRLSLADMDQDAPFSEFKGVQRLLTVIEGRGVTLSGAGQVLRIAPLCPTGFDGALALDGALIDGPVRNLNLMFRPDLFAAQAEALRGAMTRDLGAAPQLHRLIHIVDGAVRVNGQELGPQDTAECAGQGVALRCPEDSIAVLITLRRRAEAL